MTAKEIYKEVFEDIPNLGNKLLVFRKDFGKAVLKTSRYPYTKGYFYKTREKKNTFIINFTALKRGSWNNPIVSFHCIYSRPEGKYGVTLTLNMRMISIYPPHFFKRYRERIVKDESISNEDLIRQYFKNAWGLLIAVVDENYEAVYHTFENKDENDIISFVAAANQGFLFGEKQGNINIIKTIISEDMLFENQKSIFNSLRNDYKKENKEIFGVTL